MAAAFSVVSAPVGSGEGAGRPIRGASDALAPTASASRASASAMSPPASPASARSSRAPPSGSAYRGSRRRTPDRPRRPGSASRRPSGHPAPDRRSRAPGAARSGRRPRSMRGSEVRPRPAPRSWRRCPPPAQDWRRARPRGQEAGPSRGRASPAAAAACSTPSSARGGGGGGAARRHRTARSPRPCPRQDQRRDPAGRGAGGGYSLRAFRCDGQAVAAGPDPVRHRTGDALGVEVSGASWARCCVVCSPTMLTTASSPSSRCGGSRGRWRGRGPRCSRVRPGRPVMRAQPSAAPVATPSKRQGRIPSVHAVERGDEMHLSRCPGSRSMSTASRPRGAHEALGPVHRFVGHVLSRDFLRRSWRPRARPCALESARARAAAERAARSPPPGGRRRARPERSSATDAPTGSGPPRRRSADGRRSRTAGPAGSADRPEGSPRRAAERRIRPGRGGEKGLGVGMARAAVDRFLGPLLDDAAEVHDRDAGGDVLHHTRGRGR